MVRQAMVKIMLSSMPQQRQEKVRVGEDGLAAGERARMIQQGEDGITSQTLASQEGTDYPSECILWCTIALGALVQGCSSEFVSYLWVDAKPFTAVVVNLHILMLCELLHATRTACPRTVSI